MNEYEKTALDAPDSFVKRPTFLSVLCIITFLVSGYYLITGIVGLFSDQNLDPAQMAQVNEAMSEAMEGADASTRAMLENFMNALTATIRSAMANSTALAAVGLVSCLLSLGGAYLMFMLKRTGYYLYVTSKVIGVVGTLVLLGINVVTIVMVVVLSIIALLFILLYGTQRKYMS